MALFKRSRPDRTPDEHLPLTVPQAARVRELARASFAEAGREMQVFPGHLVDADGGEFGLWNLAAMCHDSPERAWPALVHEHVRAALAPQQEIAELSDRELEPLVYWRLVETQSLPDHEGHPTSERIGDRLTVVLSVDLPESVLTPPEEAWADRGGVGRWQETGRANLLALLLSDDLVHERMRHPDGAGDFDVVMGDSFFTGSVALLHEHLLRRFSPEAAAARGLLVAVPFRHQLAYRVIDGTPDSALALQNLFRFALMGFSDAPGPLSPHVYWVRDGRWEQVTELVDGEPRVVVSEELAAALGIEGED